MANIKSAQKAIRSSKRKSIRNSRVKNEMRQAIKDLKKSLEKGESKDIKTKLSLAYKKIDKAAKTNVIHKNTASRYKSRLTKFLNKTKETKVEKK